MESARAKDRPDRFGGAALGADLSEPADPLRMVVDDDVEIVLAAIGNSPIGRMVSAINVASPEIGREPP